VPHVGPALGPRMEHRTPLRFKIETNMAQKHGRGPFLCADTTTHFPSLFLQRQLGAKVGANFSFTRPSHFGSSSQAPPTV